MTSKGKKNKINPKCFLDIEIPITEESGRIVIEVYQHITPKTSKNFMCLCTGEKGTGKNGKPLHYKGSTFHRVEDFVFVQGGDIISHDGSGGESIYGSKFKDENFKTRHTEEGMVSMAVQTHLQNVGKNTNASQFFITLQPAKVFDKKHVVFGKVVQGLDVVKKMEQAMIAARVELGQIPKDKRPRIADSGVLP